jgi:hypothetical protein
MHEYLRYVLTASGIRFTEAEIEELAIASENVRYWIGQQEDTFPRTCEPMFINGFTQDGHGRR